MSIPTNAGAGDDRGGLAIDRLASALHRGLMPKLGAATATRAGLTIAGYGGDAAIGLDAATTTTAGAQTAAHYALTAQLTQATAWTAATGLYAANWSGFGTAGFSDVKYRKNVDGSVQLLGMCKKSIGLVLPDTMLTLLAGFRPATTHIFSVASASGAHAEVRVNPAGAVFIQVGGSNVWVALESLSFDPAQ
jgi:hypothetical protein